MQQCREGASCGGLQVRWGGGEGGGGGCKRHDSTQPSLRCNALLPQIVYNLVGLGATIIILVGGYIYARREIKQVCGCIRAAVVVVVVVGRS